jgi:hypothetical protein
VLRFRLPPEHVELDPLRERVLQGRADLTAGAITGLVDSATAVASTDGSTAQFFHDGDKFKIGDGETVHNKSCQDDAFGDRCSGYKTGVA